MMIPTLYPPIAALGRGQMIAAVEAALPPTTGVRALADLAASDLVGVLTASENANYFSPDKLHPTGESPSGVEGGGYGAMAAIVVAAVTSLT
jgi:hypothetical protein